MTQIDAVFESVHCVHRLEFWKVSQAKKIENKKNNVSGKQHIKATQNLTKVLLINLSISGIPICMSNNYNASWMRLEIHIGILH